MPCPHFFRDPDYALYRDLLAANCRADMLARLRAAESIGGRSANDQFLAGIERLTRSLRPGKRGPTLQQTAK